MAANWQKQLLARVIGTGDVKTALDYGIASDDFIDPGMQGLFDYVLNYYKAHSTAGSVLGPEALKTKLPAYSDLLNCDDPGMTTTALCHEVRMEKVQHASTLAVQEFNLNSRIDPVGSLTSLQSKLKILQHSCTPKNIDVAFSAGAAAALTKYHDIIEGRYTGVFSWPWEPLERELRGIRKSDYIIFYGRPKSMKSWMLCYMIAWFIMTKSSERALIYSKEMTADEIIERVACILSMIDFGNYNRGTLTPDEYQRFTTTVQWAREYPFGTNIKCLSAKDMDTGRDTVTWLDAKAEIYQPAVIFIDGLYLMSADNTKLRGHERVEAVSRAIRQMNLRREIPVIATVQANRPAAKNEEARTEDVASSDSLSQDATMLIRTINEYTRTKQRTVALVMGGACRNTDLEGFRINARPGGDFSYYGELSKDEADKTLRADEAVKEAKGKKQPPAAKKKDNAEDEQTIKEMEELVAP